jgi:hypothetical protein
VVRRRGVALPDPALQREYGELELRRRQSLERVHAILITEDGLGE